MLPPLVNGKFQKPQELMLEPMQLAALLVIDGVAMAVQTGANQLGGFLKLEREAQILTKVLALLVHGTARTVPRRLARAVVAARARRIQFG